MTADVGGEFVFEDAEIFLPPAIADGVFAGDAEVAPTDDDLLSSSGIAGIEETDGFAAVRQILCHDACIALEGDDGGLFAEWILVDGEDLVIGEQAKGKGIEFGEVVAE